MFLLILEVEVDLSDMWTVLSLTPRRRTSGASSLVIGPDLFYHIEPSCMGVFQNEQRPRLIVIAFLSSMSMIYIWSWWRSKS